MHYICTGECGGVSEKPGVCQAEECSKHGDELTTCSCADGNHDTIPAYKEEEDRETIDKRFKIICRD